ncbi:MAG: dicarboxylate/amino acid:cation symporter [Clostridium perfringens]|nr:dicarboxylate/amino acid:cation symporter [Clostridium perfringens]
MNIAFKSKTLKERTASLGFKMTISLLLGVVVGMLILLLKSNLISNGNGNIWNIINNIFFQDISVDEGKNAIGLFYIIGQLFLNSLQLIIVPMIFSSIALSMCHISDTKKLGRISKKTLLNFLTTSIFALIVAIIFGYVANKLGLFTVNIGNIASAQTASSQNPLLVIIDAVPSNITAIFSTNSRVLAVVVLAVITGLCINSLGDKILILKKLLEDVNNIITIFLNFIINKFGPIAVFILISRTFAVYGLNHLSSALSYMLVVALASILFLLVGYPLFIYVKTGLNPLIFMRKMSKVALLGFSAASSAAALSLNQKTSVEELGISEDISSFTLPLGMTINMNGTAIMQVIATVFIAASSGYAITLQNMIVISSLALIASIGTPSAPGSSSIILFSILTGMGYNNPSTLIAYSLILAINRPIDMLITSLNVIGDAATALVVAKSENSLDEKIYNS